MSRIVNGWALGRSKRAGNGMLLGKEISSRVLLARWGYAELMSSRFGHKFGGPEATRLRGKARAGHAFEDLHEPDVDWLVQALEASRSFLAPIAASFATYTCQAWSREQVYDLWVMPALDWRRHLQPPCFLRMTDFVAEPKSMGPDRSGDVLDPRVVADQIPRKQLPVPCEPAVAVPAAVLYEQYRRENRSVADPVPSVGKEPLVLLEGYLRTMLYLRDATNGQRWLVWLPTELAEVSA